MVRSGSRRAKVLAAAGAVTALVSVGGTYAVAGPAGGSRADQQRGLTATAQALADTGTSAQGSCKVGFDTQTGSLIPPDDSTSDNVAAGTVAMKKQCPGAVIAVLSAEVTATSSTPGSMHLDMRATCTGTGGFTDPCTVGEQVFGQPGHTFFADGVAQNARTHTMQMVFPGLKRGLWTFEALPGSAGASAFLGFRTFVVTAYKGG